MRIETAGNMKERKHDVALVTVNGKVLAIGYMMRIVDLYHPWKNLTCRRRSGQ